MKQPDFSKSPDGLLPAVVQDSTTAKILMLGYMNQESWQKTQQLGKVTFYSRSKKRLWTKGEESGNYLTVQSMLLDCDRDTILIQAIPHGPTCHTGSDTCFDEANCAHGFLPQLENIIEARKNDPQPNSYTSTLFAKGINKIAQKVGEEAVELIIEAKDTQDELFLNEAADLMYHYLILLQAKGYKLADIEQVLRSRHQRK